MQRRSLLGVAVAGLLLAHPAVAGASCPSGYMSAGPAVGGDPAPPAAFAPGATIDVHGSRFEVPAGTEVTLRWGIDGDVVGRALAGEDGSWTLTLTLPAELEAGTHVLSAHASLPDGTTAPGLPSYLFLAVGAPPPALPPPVVPEPVLPEPVAVQPAERAAAEPAPVAPARAVEERATVPAQALPPRRAVVAAAPAAATIASPAPTAAAPRATDAARVATPRAAPVSASAPPRDSDGAEAASSRAPARAVPAAAVGDPARDVMLALVAAALALAVLAVPAFLARRRRHAEERSAELEAALQELIAEERARRAQEERVG